mmetsp:Transcript_38860/g.97328  ORF Transcript_38860/g.97328 Transcript_38860/m.97328 type:complete len:124 (+) Transcript_38860:109-480(+)
MGRREEETYVEKQDYYTFGDLGVRYKDQIWCLDATRKGNVARFINHSCDGGNLVLRHFAPISGKHHLPPRLCMVAKRNIAKGEELCYSYRAESEEAKWEKKFADGDGTVLCLCGTGKCMGWVF